MKMCGYQRVLWATVALGVGVGGQVQARPADAPAIISRIDFQKSGLEPGARSNVQGYFNYKLKSVSGVFRVADRPLPPAGCDNPGCAQTLGRTLGAGRVVLTRLARKGNDCVVRSSVYDVNRRKGGRTIVEQGPCTEENLFILLENAVIRLARFDSGAARRSRRTSPARRAPAPQANESGPNRYSRAFENRSTKPEKINPQAPSVGSVVADALVKKASEYGHTRRYSRALMTAREALRASPGNQQALRIMGSAACMLRSAREARWAYARMNAKNQHKMLPLCRHKGVHLPKPKMPGAKASGVKRRGSARKAGKATGNKK